MSVDYKAAFMEEARELLGELEGSLLELEEAPENSEIIGRCFRALHTIKGSGAMFGFDKIAAFTHEVETAFDLIRDGFVKADGELIGLTLSACDQIRCLLEAHEEEGEADRNIIAAFKRITSAASTTQKDVPEPGCDLEPECDAPEAASGDFPVTYRIRFRPAKELLATGSNPLILLKELQELGPCRIVAQTDAIPALDEIDPEGCFTYWDVILSTSRGIDAIRDIFIFVEDLCTLTIDTIDIDDDAGGERQLVGFPRNHKKLGEILIERGDLDPGAFQGILSRRKPFGQMLVEAGVVDPGHVESACAEQQHIKELRSARMAGESSSSLRVPAERLDKLINLVGELVTVQACLTRSAALQSDPEIVSIAEEVERLTVDLRDTTMNIRMVPIGSTFSKLKRLVRDLSNELGKSVAMMTEGAETELDKTLIERLSDPLVHLIRNSIDHGIETPKEREAAGKPPQGTLRIGAFHTGASVVIQVADDGAGIDSEAIRAKAVSKGMIAPDAELSEKEALSLIFAPGFSTAKDITSISGRGVGMDVVKRNIEALRGAIEIESAKGTGTTITLRLPLTLAIIDGLLVQIGAGQFVVPLQIVQECIELTAEDRAASNGRELAYVRGEIVPYIRLREKFMVGGEPPPVEQIIITEAAEYKVGLVVDHVIGEHQTVIKNLGKMFGNIEGISGATILGDGKVALILDVPKLVQEVEMVAEAV